MKSRHFMFSDDADLFNALEFDWFVRTCKFKLYVHHHGSTIDELMDNLAGTFYIEITKQDYERLQSWSQSET
jgi:predicted RNase H-like HicB family nuclease